MGILACLIVGVILFVILRPYFIRYDTLVSFSGGLGSGKTFMTVHLARTLYRKQQFRVWFHNHIKRHITREPKKELPLLLSNIPVKISRKQYAVRLKKEHLLLQERIPEGSVCVLDEVDCFANQFQFNNPCIVDQVGGGENGNFDEFCRFYRHYTKGGYLIFNTQATANENLVIRRRQNTCFNLMRFRKWGIPIIWPCILFTVKIRNITLSEEIKTVEENNTEDNMRTYYGFFPLFRTYDTYCYSERYKHVPKLSFERHNSMKTERCIVAPKGKQEKFTPKF